VTVTLFPTNFGAVIAVIVALHTKKKQHRKKTTKETRMAKTQMKDIILLIPGIMGSVLQKDGQDLWSSSKVIKSTVTGLGHSSLQQLQMQGDDPDIDDLEDGVQANRLITVPRIIAGLTKTDDYSILSRLITDNFHVTKADVDDDNPANFFEFPYDWRRDNRVAARKLNKLIDQRLPQWREYTGNKDAKVIILAHSMGGLVARCYLEVLEGWKNCRALVTFGTPYRGAIDAVNFVANGYKQKFLELTEVVRSFTSVYQLMPIYEMVKIGENYQRVAEIQEISNIDKKRAEQALAFHREIETAVKQHQKDVQYLQTGYKIIPFVGFRQDTFQSVEMVDGKLKASYELPNGVDSSLGEGDGTVPRLSAIPIELDQDYRETYIAQRHSCLQSSPQILSDLCERLKRMQISHRPIRGPELSNEIDKRPAISLNIDDLYVASEPIELCARIVNLKTDIGVLQGKITPVEENGRSLLLDFQQQEYQWVLTIDGLPPGLYRLEVQTRMQGPLTPIPVKDVFEVVN
jgi:pimeloyl-ACP methyl ester carboxylesterase